MDAFAETALENGATPAADPVDHGFMYGRSFYDLDGHHWEVMWMDPVAAEQGPAEVVETARPAVRMRRVTAAAAIVRQAAEPAARGYRAPAPDE